MHSRSISEIQRRLLAFVAEHTNEHGYAPTLAEIAEALGCAVPNAQYHINFLARQGFIVVQPNTARSIRLTALALPEEEKTEQAMYTIVDTVRTRLEKGFTA